MSAAGDHVVVDAEPLRGGDTPRQHVLAAHAVLESRLALEHEHVVAGASQLVRHAGPRESAAHDDRVEAHAVPRPRWKSGE